MEADCQLAHVQSETKTKPNFDFVATMRYASILFWHSLLLGMNPFEEVFENISKINECCMKNAMKMTYRVIGTYNESRFTRNPRGRRHRDPRVNEGPNESFGLLF